MPTIPRRSNWLNLVLIVAALSACSGPQPQPTPTLSTITAPATTAPTRPVPSPVATATPTRESPTPTPTVTPTAEVGPLPVARKGQRKPLIEDINRLQILAEWDTGAEESSYFWSPDGSRILLLSKSVARLIDTMTCQQVWENPGGSEAEFSTDGSLVRIHKGAEQRIYRSKDGVVVGGNVEFVGALPTLWLKPLSEIKAGFIPASDNSLKGNYHDFLAIVEAGNTAELRQVYHDSLKTLAVFKGLPPGVSGYSASPDGSLLLVTAREDSSPTVYRAVLLGINNGFESSLPIHKPEGPRAGFHPTRPGSGVTQQFPVLISPLTGQSRFPAPISPPSVSFQNYQLKPWDETQTLDPIKQLVEFATANDVFGPASGRGNLFEAEEALRFALKEYLLRYPAGAYRVPVQWRLAMTDTILGSNQWNEWIASQVADMLNQGLVTPDNLSLNAALSPLGFYVDAGLITLQI
jgi:hypothetical protein